jgi:hypothetical protein
MRTVEFYRLPNGNRPIEEFLDSLTGKQAQKVLWVLRLVEELEVVPRQYFKKPGDYPHLLRPHIWVAKALDNSIFGGEKQAQTSRMLRTSPFADLWVITRRNWLTVKASGKSAYILVMIFSGCGAFSKAELC